MSGIFSLPGEMQASVYRLRLASKYDDGLNGPKTVQQQLADKQWNAALPFRMAPKDVRNANAAMGAMEEAKRIANPKAHAEQRLAEVERRLEELRAEMRLAAARGDREKVMDLAREAAQLAREAGRAAKAYASGVSAAASMGKGATGSGVHGISVVETVRETSVTTLTIASVETSVEVRIGSGAAAAPAASAAPVPEEPPHGETAAMAQALAGVMPGLPPPPAGSSAGDLMGRMIGDNDLKLARYKEADAFGRRVEAVLGHVRNALTDAKAANESDLDESRRRQRRKQLDDYDKVVADAQEEVNVLRGAALEGGLTAGDLIAALPAAGGNASVAAPVVLPSINLTV